MKSDDDTWSVVHNDEDLVKIIAEITKAQAHSKKPQEKSEASDIAPNKNLRNLQPPLLLLTQVQ